ncbi:MAG: AAA family ATPase [Pyrinomonadaceae bacterium]|nr:AAA family ATPase [Pyrinomonadaceae bacterium]
MIPEVDAVFSSEPYGDTFAACLGAKHYLFDKDRTLVPVSATAIRQKSLTHWHYLPRVVQPFFVKKIALLGSESTGKTTLAEKLAAHYHTTFVPEAAREVIGHTNDCTPADLVQLASLHAQNILAATPLANRLLFLDTELTITRSYSQFLFHQNVNVPEWVEKANRCDLYLFLTTDCPFVQDGTRLSETEREALSAAHLAGVKKASLPCKIISGHWQERLQQACREVDHFISQY